MSKWCIFVVLIIIYYSNNVVSSFHHCPSVKGQVSSWSCNNGYFSKTRKLFLSSSSPSNEINILKPKSSSSSHETVTKIERFSRLPVWPFWNGVLIFVIGKLFGFDVASKLEDQFGGRVCPNFFVGETTSPFLMLVHHVHSFAYGDLLRYFQRTFFPEGFPAHPHRGFITVTYVLRGGLVHRDSLGIKEMYGAESRHKGKHTQWMITGSGLLHEEMWDIPSFNLKTLLEPPSHQELYQLWLNLPATEKLCTPKSILLGGKDETPTVCYNNTKTIILCGEYHGEQASIQVASPVDIFHVCFDTPSSQWSHSIPYSHKTVILYMRKGSVMIGDTLVPTHCTAFITSSQKELLISNHGEQLADFIFLSGEPLNEPIASKGSMVMNNQQEIDQAYQDYEMGKMGVPWRESLSDEEWKDHIRQFLNL